MTTHLPRARIAEITKEAEELYPNQRSNGNDIYHANDMADGKQEAYISAATKYALLIEQERERVKGLVEAIEFVINSPHPEYCKTKLETALNQYKSI